MLGYTLEIVSSSHRIDQIREDLFTFLNISFLNFLKSLSIDQYTTYQNGVISRLETPLTLVEAAAENWLEIEERRYLFHAKKDRLCLLPTLSLTDVVNFYEKYFLDSPDRKILIIESSSSV